MCIFCEIAKGERPAKLVHEDDEVVAFSDINPQAPTHLLVIPRQHITSLAHADPSDAVVLGKLLLVAGKVARDAGLVEGGYRVVINTGAGADQSVFHIHVHVLGGRRMKWPPG